MDYDLSVYLPQDRRQALASGNDLPERTSGAALFADISGFTPLTEALDRALGARRGVEAMTQQINQVYDALIAEVERYGGSVIGFAGDSITCWFDDASFEFSVLSAELDQADHQNSTLRTQNSKLRPVACAIAMQAAMRQFASIALPDGTSTALALKVAVAYGAARRLVVGDPTIQLFDVLAGATLTRMAAAEHLAAKGEVVIDEPTATALGEAIQIAGWRVDAETGERFAVLAPLQISDFRFQIEDAAAQTQSPISNLQSEMVRPWLLPAVYERHQAGLGDFLTELRPAVALFLRFSGIDYDADPAAGAKLDTFTRRMQQLLARYDGTLLQLTIGDKGSYFYAVFGVPTSHEDDARRAARAALETLALPETLDFLQPLQIGISRGVLRVGASGGATRKTYAALGDDVNLAARLMSRAAPGEALISGRVQSALGAEFALEPRAPISLKGKAEPLPVFALLAVIKRRAIRLEEPVYTLPMVGRTEELALIGQKLDLALSRQGQIVGITAEAGIGKSRLLAEAIRLARRKGMQGYGGACQSYGTNMPYLVWGAIWRAFFDIDPGVPRRRQIRALEHTIEDLAPDRVESLPLLGPLLGLELPENDFTEKLEPQLRKSALHALLLDCLRAAAREAAQDGGGLLLVLEDLHWIDALSHELLDAVARASADLPILIVVAYRPPELLRLQAPRIEALPHFTGIVLGELSAANAEHLIRAKLAQLFPERAGVAPAALISRVILKAQG